MGLLRFGPSLGRASVAGLVVAGGLLAWPAGAAAGAQERLQNLLDRVVAEHRLVPGASLYVEGAREGLPFDGASGRTALGIGLPLHPDDPYRIASVTKPFTAAAILRLVEGGRLSLADPVARFLPAGLVNRMHVFGGVNYGPQITIRELLNHTSGLNSHDECAQFLVLVGAQPRKRWTPEEEIELMIDCGDPYFAPGRGFHYSDTGYIMLGSIITKLTGMNLAASFRELLPLRRLGLHETWHELLEPAPSGIRARAHQYFALFDLSRYDPSFDSWGGGGLDATNRDLARFIRGLFDGDVFRQRSTLATMLETVPVPGAPGSLHWGLGIARRNVAGVDCWGHTGVWGNFIGYCPDLDVALAGTTNQGNDPQPGALQAIYEGAIAIVMQASERRRAISVVVRPGRVRAGRRTRFRFTTTATGRPVGGARISFAGRHVETQQNGTAAMTARLRRAGQRQVMACKARFTCGTTSVRVRR